MNQDSFSLMELEKHRFSGLDTAIDRTHALFDRWEAQGTLHPPLDDDTLQQMKLAVHEWVANLVQHANFDCRHPEIVLDVSRNGNHVQCAIEDNSEGFSLDDQLRARQDVLDAFPERGMGLLMIRACTEGLSYRQIGGNRHRLEFCISADKDPWLNIPF